MLNFRRIKIPRLFYQEQKPLHMPMTRMFGVELEFFLVNKEGNIVNSADSVISELKNKLKETDIKKECAHSMIEITSFPHLSSSEVFGKFFSDFETLLYQTEKLDVSLFNYGCYPGINNTQMRDDGRYIAQKAIFGEKEFVNAGKCIGFHSHYSLPTNSFNRNVKFFFLDIKLKKKLNVLNLFNLYIALDPALTTLMQSSPYFEGTLAGKDARMMVYRGDPDISLPNSVYAKYPEFGILNDYSDDFETMVKRIRDRTTKLKNLLSDHGYDFKDFIKSEVSLLDSSWKPVKISPHGTIESRGSDMNTLPLIASSAVVLKNLSRYIEKHNISILPSEIGNSEPFTIEDETLHVPLRQHLQHLQKNSAFVGMENAHVHDYTKRLLRLTKKVFTKDQYDSIQPLLDMVDEQQTTSDKIIQYVKKIQGKDYQILEKETAQKIALQCANNLYKDVLISKKMFERHDDFTLY